MQYSIANSNLNWNHIYILCEIQYCIQVKNTQLYSIYIAYITAHESSACQQEYYVNFFLKILFKSNSDFCEVEPYATSIQNYTMAILILLLSFIVTCRKVLLVSYMLHVSQCESFYRQGLCNSDLSKTFQILFRLEKICFHHSSIDSILKSSIEGSSSGSPGKSAAVWCAG